MAEEDLIFGKNRHLFGGIEPSTMKRFVSSARRSLDSGELVTLIKIELPEDTVVGEQTICTVAGAVIRRSTNGYPETEFDGELVADIKENCVYTDGNVERGLIYYYSAFPYSDQGVYLRRSSNRTRASFVGDIPSYIFGYDLDTTESDPDERVIYPDEVDNDYYTPARMNYSADVFDYGSWPIEGGFMPKPCMLKYDGTVYEYLDINDYTKNIDGNDSEVANTSFGGNAMMEWPKIYTKRWEDSDGTYHFRCSDVKVDSSWDCWCNYDANDNEIDHFYTAIYTGGYYNDRLRSCSGLKYNNDIYSTQLRNATTNGDGWCIEVLADRLLIADLLVLIARNTDTSSCFGVGWTNGSSGAGETNTRGLFHGSTSGSTVKVFGMENWWNGQGRCIAGLFGVKGDAINGSSTSRFYAKITWGTHDGTNCIGFEPDINTNSGYSGGCLELYVLPYDKTSQYSYEGYITKLTTKSWGRIFTGVVSTLVGSSSTYEADYLRQSKNLDSSVMVYNLYASSCGTDGAFGMRIGSSVTNPEAALSCKPLAK